MFIASQLKKQNIVEYLLYMWQIEDLIRAFSLDIDAINEKIIEPYQVSAEEKKQLYDWYVSLIDMMRSENVQQSGHIQLNKNVIILLNEFHQEMMSRVKSQLITGLQCFTIIDCLRQKAKRTFPTSSCVLTFCTG